MYDFYGELLTKHQQRIYESVVYENLSLGEIAEAEGVSRQAVHDIVKRCDRTLLGYEEKLKLIEKFQTIKAKVSGINQLSEQLEKSEQVHEGEYSSYGIRIKQLSSEILQEL